MNSPLMSTSSTLLGLTFLIVLFALALWFVKRGNLPRTLRGGPLRVLASHGIGPGQQLLIVQVGAQTLLVGASAQSVNLICEIDSPLAATSPDAAATAGGQSDLTAPVPASAEKPATGTRSGMTPLPLHGSFGTLLNAMMRR